MSTSTLKLNGFVGEGNSRVVTVGVFVLAIVAYAALPHLPDQSSFNSWMTEKSPILYITVLTVQAAFLAAVLTIWTLMKTRASRYVERLADSASFAEFISAFEIRLVLGCVAVLATGVVTVAGWTLTATQSPEAVLILAWACICVVSTALLIDSLLTARILL